MDATAVASPNSIRDIITACLAYLVRALVRRCRPASWSGLVVRNAASANRRLQALWTDGLQVEIIEKWGKLGLGGVVIVGLPGRQKSLKSLAIHRVQTGIANPTREKRAIQIYEG